MQTVSVEDLSSTSAPISLLFERLTGLPSLAITLIAILATMNGVVIILIMAARVCYGMAREGRLPAWLGVVSPRSRTPVRATLVVAGLVVVLALFTPLDTLAETSSEVLLTVFAVVNLALVWFKLRGVPASDGIFKVHIVFPLAGTFSCIALVVGAALVER
jgi:amino acid transporter